MSKSVAYALSAAAIFAPALTPVTSYAATPAISTRSSAPLPPATSSYLAGYQATEVGISRASMSFVVPPMNCPTSDTQGTGLGIGNEQTAGAPTLLVIVYLACVSGAPYVLTSVQAGTTTNQGAAAPGDQIKILVTQTKKRIVATITDVTTGAKVTASDVPTPDNTMVFGSFPLFSGSMLPVADFGAPVTVTSAYLENALLRDWSPTKLERSDGANVQVQTSSFSSRGNFKLKFLHN